MPELRNPKSAFAALALFLLFLSCGPACLAGDSAAPPLNAGVGGLIAAAKLKNASVGVSVIEVKSGRVLCAIGDQALMPPASNMKLITTGAALLLLGDKFQFTTTVYAAGPVDAQGVLGGDLVVVASGDPAISGREHGGSTTAVLKLAGIVGIVCGGSAVYLAMAELINEMYGRVVLPIGPVKAE